MNEKQIKNKKLVSSKMVQVRWKLHFEKKRLEEVKKLENLLNKKGIAGSCSYEALIVIAEHFIKPKEPRTKK